ncbi:hypothetical protein So717_05820 [Roseobacter cerasinus]|uniref:PH domain-containing protein n=1 Tax=Roseobacter cerasinus TaxID=2602289 RepID=A0A640VL66_9RHOB|nr:hypothetical protein [Roseobacter cerasinus]GFE48829.1 hypothetical protein So717_05820 [Roseobacter cerasinus]
MTHTAPNKTETLRIHKALGPETAFFGVAVILWIVVLFSAAGMVAYDAAFDRDLVDTLLILGATACVVTLVYVFFKNMNRYPVQIQPDALVIRHWRAETRLPWDVIAGLEERKSHPTKLGAPTIVLALLLVERHAEHLLPKMVVKWDIPVRVKGYRIVVLTQNQYHLPGTTLYRLLEKNWRQNRSVRVEGASA